MTVISTAVTIRKKLGFPKAELKAWTKHAETGAKGQTYPSIPITFKTDAETALFAGLPAQRALVLHGLNGREYHWLHTTLERATEVRTELDTIFGCL